MGSCSLYGKSKEKKSRDDFKSILWGKMLGYSNICNMHAEKIQEKSSCAFCLFCWYDTYIRKVVFRHRVFLNWDHRYVYERCMRQRSVSKMVRFAVCSCEMDGRMAGIFLQDSKKDTAFLHRENSCLSLCCKRSSSVYDNGGDLIQMALTLWCVSIVRFFMGKRRFFRGNIRHGVYS